MGQGAEDLEMQWAAGVGHNNPPDPIDAITAIYDNSRVEAENWADGTPVENEAQMQVVNELRKDMRTWRIALEAGQKSATAPMYDVYKAELSRWKVPIEDAKRIEGCLVSAVDGFMRKLAADKEAARKKAEAEAWEATRKAQEAARESDSANLEEQRAAAQAMADAEEKQRLAMAAKNDTVKGMREVTRYEITDHRALLNWIAKNARDDMTAFIEEWARKNHKTASADGLRVWKTKEAF